MLELYHAELAPCAQKVRLVLGEKSLPYESHVIDIIKKENLNPAYLRLNPNGVVPTLVHDGDPIIESTLINEYLDMVFPDRSLRPGDARARVAMRIWTKLVDEKLHPANGALTWAVSLRRQFLSRGIEEARAAIGKLPDPVRRARQLRILDEGFEAPDVRASFLVFSETFDRMEKALDGRRWLVGDNFTLADIALVPYVQCVDQWGYADLFLTRAPAVARWFGQVRERPSFQREILGLISQHWRERILADGAEARADVARALSA